MTANALQGSTDPTAEAGKEVDYSRCRVAERLSSLIVALRAEVVQLYVRDLVGSVTRPASELKGFQRLALDPGESRQVVFELHTDDLAFHNIDMERVTEPGGFGLWTGSHFQSGLQAKCEVMD